MTSQDLRELYEVRLALELMAVRLGGPRLDTATLARIRHLHQSMEVAVRADGHTVRVRSEDGAERFDWGLERFVDEARALASDARSRAFVIYLDIEHVSAGGAHAARAPLVSMLNELIGGNDLVALATSSVRRVTWADAEAT